MLIKFLRKDGLMDDFNIEWLIERCKDQFDAEITTSAVTNLVDKGLIEQYIDEDGNFKFTLTDLGRSIAKKLEEDGLDSFWDAD
jgi:predicted transcriptional regulator